MRSNSSATGCSSCSQIAAKACPASHSPLSARTAVLSASMSAYQGSAGLVEPSNRATLLGSPSRTAMVSGPSGIRSTEMERVALGIDLQSPFERRADHPLAKRVPRLFSSDRCIPRGNHCSGCRLVFQIVGRILIPYRYWSYVRTSSFCNRSDSKGPFHSVGLLSQCFLPPKLRAI
jgi:hypothetical protein